MQVVSYFGREDVEKEFNKNYHKDRITFNEILRKEINTSEQLNKESD